MDRSSDIIPQDSEPIIGSGKTRSTKRIPNCQRCQNHGIKVAVKYHKRDCPNRFCCCENCLNTAQRQHVMRVATAQRRARIQEEEISQLRKKASVVSDTGNESKNCEKLSSPECDGHQTGTQSTKANSKPFVKVRTKISPQKSLSPLPSLQSLPCITSPAIFEPKTNLDQVERLLRNSESLLQKLGASPELIYLMYVILKDCWADDNEAMKRITKAIIQMKALKEHQDADSNIYHHPRCSRSIGTLGNPTYIGQVPNVSIVATKTSDSMDSSLNSYGSQPIGGRDVPTAQEYLSCSDLENIEAQVKKVAKLLQRFGYSWDINSVSYMYVILQAAKGNIDVAEHHITDAVIEIRRSEHFKALMLSSPHCSGYVGSLRTLGNPMLFGAIPYFGMTLSPTMANLNLFPNTVIAQPLRVPFSSETPPEQPPSYHEASASHHLKVEKKESTDGLAE